MRIKKYKIRIASFTFLFCLLSLISNAQSGLSRFDAYLGTDAPYDQLFSMTSAYKEAWHKFKVTSSDRKVITVTTNDLNPLYRVDVVKLYKGSSNSLQFVMDSYPIQSNDSVATIFLDSNIVAVNDTIYLRLLRSENSGCTDCINNNTLNYRLVVAENYCSSVTVNLDSHFPFDGRSCNVSNGQVASACTLKVCAGEPLCLRASFFAVGAFPMCGPGSMSIPSGAASTPITMTSNFSLGSYHVNYCFTSATTPGIYQVNVCWTHFRADYDCDNDEPPAVPPFPWWQCCGRFYIEVGPPAPLNLGYTISPNPVCKGSSACLTANQANISGYSYLFETGTSSMSNVVSPTGVVCPTYTTAGNIPTALTVYNGFCPSPRVTQILPVLNPSITASVTQINCRKYTLTANPVCITGNINYTWNIGGQIFTGNPVTVDLPGNSSTVSYSLTAAGSNGSFSTSGNIINVPTASLSFTAQHTSCKNITYTATPSSCFPSNYIIKWTIGGVIHYGNPIVVSEGSTSNVHLVNPVVTVLDYSGNVLFTQTYTPYNIAVTAGTPVCCTPNTDCVRTLGGASGRTEGTCEAISWSTSQTLSGNPPPYTNKAFTVAPNVTITISANARIKFTDCTFQMGQGSKIVINKNANSLILENCYLHGCQQLWDGIKTENSTASSTYKTLVKIDNSLIEDAVVALDASVLNFYSRIFVNNTVFNKNITGIKYINKPKNESTGVQNAISVINCVFTCKQYVFAVYPSFQNGLTMYNNYLVNTADTIPLTKSGLSYHQKSLIGISVEGVFYNTAADNVLQYVPLADTLLVTENLIYNNLVQGIASKGLNLNAFKGNNFKNISSPLAGGNYPTYNTTNTASIYLTGRGYSLTTGATLAYTTNKIGTTNSSLSQRNKFTNCYYGVYAKDEPIDVTQNDFTDCYNGIYITNARVPSLPSSLNTSVNCTIKSNRIIRVKQTGIALVNNVAINAEVTSNVINNVTAPNFTSRAADISESSPVTSAKYLLLDNYFTKVWNGARINLVYKPVVTHNIISLNTVQTFNSSVNAAPYNTGIHINSCTDPQVNDNSITEPNNTNTWWEQGIVVVSSANGRYFCNNVNGTFSAITTGSTCSGTKIYNNDFSNAKFAHWLIYSNVIGDQYNPTTSLPPNIQPADNRYYNIAPYYSYAQNSTLASINARFFNRGSAPFAMPSSLNYAADVSTSIGLITFPNSFYTYTNPLPYNASGCTVLVDPCGGSPSTCRLMGMAKKIAADSLYPPIIKRDRFVSRKQLLDNLEKENIGLTGDVDIDNFPTAMEYQSVGKFHKVDMLAQQGIDNADSSFIEQAENINQSVNPMDSIEQLQKQVNEAYLYHLKRNGNLSQDKIDMLKTIAPLCPYTHGTSIWQARAMLKGIENVEYFNQCELYSALDETFISAERVLAKEEVVEVKTYFSIYPNPNDGNFTLALNNTEYTNYELEILNSFGASVKKHNVNTTENKEALIITELSQGIYFVVIKANGIVLETKKVVVTK